MKKGFTLIELLVVTGIIALMTVLILPNYRTGNNSLALQRSVHQLAQDVRRAQDMALSGRELAGEVPAGYGIYLNESQPAQYILFADLDGQGDYDGLEAIETLTLEDKVRIDELLPASPLTVVFSPPDPTVTITPDDDTASIKLGAEGLETKGFQYTYNLSWVDLGWLSPRAACDTSQTTTNCPNSFAALASDPATVYDRWRLIVRFSNRYQKTQTESSVPLQKTIEINKAGLIAIE